MGEKSLNLPKSNIIKISNKTIEHLKVEMNWEGDGSSPDPIVIENLETIPLAIKIYKSSLYLVIRNLTIDRLKCHNTQNITVQNCTVKHLIIKGCHTLTLVNNIIYKHNVTLTKGSTFISNKIAQIDKFKRNLLPTQITPLGRQLTSPLTCCLILLAVSAFVSGTPLWVIGFIPVGVLFVLNYKTYANFRRIENKPENLYLNNVGI